MIKPKIMGVVNATPDSFSDGGQFLAPSNGIAHGLQLEAEGADILDIGGESTRPGADEVSVDEELRRVIPLIEGLRRETDLPISIDTRKPEIAEAAFDVGANIWNDVSALSFSDRSMRTAVKLNAPIVLMHAKGTPKNMQSNPAYSDVVDEVLSFLSQRMKECLAAGIDQKNLIVDPGIGFGKTVEHNIALMKGLKRLTTLGPVLLGASRKRFIAALDRDGPAEERLGGSIAAALMGADAGVSYVRVHDVAETRQAFSVWEALRSQNIPASN